LIRFDELKDKFERISFFQTNDFVLRTNFDPLASPCGRSMRVKMIKRLADHNDIPVLIEMRKQLLLEEEVQPDLDIDKQLADYYAKAFVDGSFIAWVTLDNGEVIATGGICFYALIPTFFNPTGKVAYIANVYTKPAYRRQRIATELVNMAIEEAKKRNYAIIRLHTSPFGRSIYENAGFIDSNGYMALRI
jgi:ribosomal protein S18 acetylase RimI-like enzyme